VLRGDTVSQDWRPLTHVRAAGSLGARTPRNGTAWWHVRTLALIHDTIRYDTIRDAILTCARKPT